MKFLNTFAHNEDGAITVDWVVLSAAIVGLALAGVAAARSGIMSLSSDMNDSMANIDLGTTP